MVEAPDKVLLELFQIVRDEFSKSQSVPFSSLHKKPIENSIPAHALRE